jgi:hypothetical protein
LTPCSVSALNAISSPSIRFGVCPSTARTALRPSPELVGSVPVHKQHNQDAFVRSHQPKPGQIRNGVELGQRLRARAQASPRADTKQASRYQPRPRRAVRGEAGWDATQSMGTQQWNVQSAATRVGSACGAARALPGACHLERKGRPTSRRLSPLAISRAFSFT